MYANYMLQKLQKWFYKCKKLCVKNKMALFHLRHSIVGLYSLTC